MRMFALALVLAALGFAPEKPNEKSAIDEPAPIKNETELDAVVKQLNEDKTFLPALERLIELGSMRIYQVGGVIHLSGSPERDDLIERAAKIVRRHSDLAIVERALNSPREPLQFWALFHLPNGGEDDFAKWRHLVPRLRELAKVASPQIRGDAQVLLSELEDQQDFLSELVETETCAENIQHLLNGPKKAERDAKLLPHVLRLLQHRTADVRRSALLFVGSNSDRAASQQVDFDQAIFQRVIELSHAPEERVRAAAIYALTDLRWCDPDAVRKRMLQLVADPADDIRWRIPAALKDQMERRDVREALERLLQDKSALVRYFTIHTLGPEKHLPELREIAAGSDREYAESARSLIKRIEEKQRSERQP